MAGDAAVVLIVEDEKDLADLYGMWIGDAYDVCFTDDSTDTIATTDVAVGASSLVAVQIADGDEKHFIVPKKDGTTGHIQLKYKPVNGTSSTIRITRS